MSKIVLLGNAGEMTQILRAIIADSFGEVYTIQEEAMQRRLILKNRLKRLGVKRVLGQLAFFGIVPLLRRQAQFRSLEIMRPLREKLAQDIKGARLKVDSINNKQTISLLTGIAPKVVVVYGTRILSGELLRATNATFINIHAGITPKYRGVHGGYWAVAQQDFQNCGVTVHQVDEGIDTGAIYAQATIQISQADNFTTYPLLQFVAGIPLVSETVENLLRNKAKTYRRLLPSKLYTHPTLREYIQGRIINGAK
jgi:methionyl-tRNA formyltransferase